MMKIRVKHLTLARREQSACYERKCKRHSEEILKINRL